MSDEQNPVPTANDLGSVITDPRLRVGIYTAYVVLLVFATAAIPAQPLRMSSQVKRPPPWAMSRRLRGRD